MTDEEKSLFTIVGWGTLFTIPLWAIGLWGFGSPQFIRPYCVVSIISSLLAVVLLICKRNYLFWHFVIAMLGYVPSMVLGMALNTGAVLIIVYGKHLSPNLIMTGTVLFFASYCYFPLKYYHDDYYRTEKDRLKSFDFDEGTYDITSPSLTRGDAFSDFFFKSFLSKAVIGVVRFHLIFPISGGAIAIIAGKISKNLQLGVGLAAFFLSTIMIIQFGVPGIFVAWQVYRLEKRYGKKIMIDWGEEEE